MVKTNRSREGRNHLTDTHRRVPGCFEAVGAGAAVATERVNALARIAYPRVLYTFITI